MKPSLPQCSMPETAAIDLAWSTAADVEATFARIRRRNPLLNAFTAIIEERALARARALDEAGARHEGLPPLAGVPFAVKNLFDIAGLTTLAGAKISRDAPPARGDATII